MKRVWLQSAVYRILKSETVTGRISQSNNFSVIKFPPLPKKIFNLNEQVPFKMLYNRNFTAIRKIWFLITVFKETPLINFIYKGSYVLNSLTSLYKIEGLFYFKVKFLETAILDNGCMISKK